MITYNVTPIKGADNIIEFEILLTTLSKDEEFFMPNWRPGRYEISNFSKKLKFIHFFDQENNEIKFIKSSKSSWIISAPKNTNLKIKFQIFANELNAGSTYNNEDILLINFINCSIYNKKYLNEIHEINLNIPTDFVSKSGMKKISDIKFIAENYHQFVDCPIFSSCFLKSFVFNISNYNINLCFYSKININFENILSDFKNVCSEQLKLFDEAPFTDYFFFFILKDNEFYHGVEHLNSTVIVIGPCFNIFEKNENWFGNYKNLLGISSHELFHSWNIKSIVPKEMFPYNYQEENYTTSTYIAEGFTTYYGDLFLYRSRFFNLDEYLKELVSNFQKHCDFGNKVKYSLLDSAFDIWLDGYEKKSVLNRYSIYTEGCIFAFGLDTFIRKNTNNKKSLDDLMKTLYKDFGKKNKPYTQKNIEIITSKLVGKNVKTFFNEYLYKITNYHLLFKESVEYYNWELVTEENENLVEKLLGIKTKNIDNNIVIENIKNDTSDDLISLKQNDILISIENKSFKNISELNGWLKYFSEYKNDIVFQIKRGIEYKLIFTKVDKKNNYFPTYKIIKNKNEK